MQLTSLTLRYLTKRRTALILLQQMPYCEICCEYSLSQFNHDVIFSYLETLVLKSRPGYNGYEAGFLNSFVVPALRNLEFPDPRRTLGSIPQNHWHCLYRNPTGSLIL
jgi:hypothetical protein